MCSTHVSQQSTEQPFEETPSRGRGGLAAIHHSTLSLHPFAAETPTTSPPPLLLPEFSASSAHSHNFRDYFSTFATLWNEYQMGPLVPRWGSRCKKKTRAPTLFAIRTQMLMPVFERHLWPHLSNTSPSLFQTLESVLANRDV